MKLHFLLLFISFSSSSTPSFDSLLIIPWMATTALLLLPFSSSYFFYFSLQTNKTYSRGILCSVSLPLLLLLNEPPHTNTYHQDPSCVYVLFFLFFVCQEISSYYILASPGEPLHTHKNTYIHSWWTRRRKMWRKHVERVIHYGSLMKMLTQVEQEGIIAKHSHVI